MSSPIRTAVAAIAVIAACILLSSLSWLNLLLAFVVTGVGWSLWSWLSDIDKRRKQDRWQRRRRREAPANSRRRRALRSANVYQFPSRERTAEVADMKGAAD